MTSNQFYLYPHQVDAYLPIKKKNQELDNFSEEVLEKCTMGSDCQTIKLSPSNTFLEIQFGFGAPLEALVFLPRYVSFEVQQALPM